MFKIHWSALLIIIICLGACFFLIYQSMVSGKPMPEGSLAVFSSLASMVIGYSAGREAK